jgi:hypothetical protein
MYIRIVIKIIISKNYYAKNKTNNNMGQMTNKGNFLTSNNDNNVVSQ